MDTACDESPDCRPGCGACCVAPSISTPIPSPTGGPPRPKAAGVACPQLDEQRRCRLFGQAERPAVCVSLRPSLDMCGPPGAPVSHALRWLHRLERLTHPDER